MEQRVRRFLAWTPLCALLFAGASHAAASSLYSGQNIFVVTGSSPGVLGDAIESGAAYQSQFSHELLSLKITGTGAPAPLSVLPLVSYGGNSYFLFLYDLQETGSGGGDFIRITDISIVAKGMLIWRLAAGSPIDLNPPATLTPRGNGADFALLAPLSLFEGKGLTGSDTFVFSSSQVDGDNGPDEWGVITASGPHFGPNDPISSVPEPSTVVLCLLGAGLMLIPRLTKRFGAR